MCCYWQGKGAGQAELDRMHYVLLVTLEKSQESSGEQVCERTGVGYILGRWIKPDHLGQKIKIRYTWALYHRDIFTSEVDVPSNERCIETKGFCFKAFVFFTFASKRRSKQAVINHLVEWHESVDFSRQP